MRIKFTLGENAVLPTQENKSDAGYDIYAAVASVVPAFGRAKVETNLKWEPIIEDREFTYFNQLGLGVYADIRDRSGNALKKGLTKMAGVVDYDYRGNIGVVLFNTTNEPINIEIGDKIAQIVFTPCFHPTVIPAAQLSDTARGEKGFGSSGVVAEERYLEPN